MRDGITGSRSTGRSGAISSSARSAALDAEDRDPCGPDLNGKGGGYIAVRNRDLLHAGNHIGDNAAGDRTAEVLTPQLLAGGGVDRIEVFADLAKKHEASRRRRHSAHARV